MAKEGGNASKKVPEWAEAREYLKPPPSEKLGDDELFLLEILSGQRKVLDQIITEFNAPRKAAGKELASKEQIASLLQRLEEKGFLSKVEVWQITSKGKHYLEGL
ncbi:MAG: hypothetical protein QXN15_09620 [Candidatus Jordarchaeales archaeon]|nr:hypothetical protein [Candidatus Jordarchaeia archaeon]